MKPGRRFGKVLVVDDLQKNTDLVSRVLAADGFEVITASGGEAALTAVAVDGPDVVLLDVMMPGLDGYETCRRLKSNPETRLVPVLLVTALRSRDDRIRGVEVGADGFLVKSKKTSTLSPTPNARGLVAFTATCSTEPGT
jgi:two-component system, cell cycle response regulator